MFDKLEKVILPVEGMSCMHCAGRVEAALGALKGVKSAKVDLEKKIAEIEYIPAKTDVSKMRAAVTAAGFDCPAE